MECPLCLADLPIELFPVIQSCHHRTCYDCFQQYLKIEISESRVNIACPVCSEPLHPNGKNDYIGIDFYINVVLYRMLVF